MTLLSFSNSAIHTKTSLNLLELSWYGAALLIVTAMGLVNLYLPFSVDTSVHMLAAKSIDQGGTLYVDFWDNKPPGLYYFHYVAGRLFGFNEFGVHLFELIWLQCFSIVLIVTLRSIYTLPWLAALVPVAAVGSYYASASEYELTQLEFLVSLPVYLSIWCCYYAFKKQKKYVLLCFLSGFFAAIATLFKLVLFPIFIAVWSVVVFLYIRSHQQALFELIVKMVIPAIAGALIPLLATVIYFSLQGALDELLWTLFVYPAEALQSAPYASKTRLITATAFLVSNFAPWLLFIGIGFISWCKTRKEHLNTLMLAWICAALVIFLIQRFSWWEYHTLLLFSPLSVLAVAGIDYTLTLLPKQFSPTNNAKFITSTIIAIPLCASLVSPFIAKAKPLLSNIVVKGNGLHGYRSNHKVSENYAHIWKSSRIFTERGNTTDAIYVFGYASIYLLTNRQPTLPIPGTWWEFYTKDQLQEILSGLKIQRTPYIFLDKEAYKAMPYKTPEIIHFLRNNYDEISHHKAGVWFLRHDLNKQ